MSDLLRSDGSLADAFLSWASPRKAVMGEAENQGASRSDFRGRWLRIMALVCSIAIHVALLLGLTAAVPRKPAGTTGGKTHAASLQLRFIEIRLHAHAQSKTMMSTALSVVQTKPMITTPRVVKATRDKSETFARPTAAPDGVATPQVIQGVDAARRSDDWNVDPRDERNAGSGAVSYIQPQTPADANVMKHSTGSITYRPTRFDSSWAPDGENAVKQAIGRATFHATIKLPWGVSIDCSGGPSSPEPLATTVPVVPIASTHCHGSPPPAPMAGKALLDIQTLAPAQTLSKQGRPPKSSNSRSEFANAARCTAARVAGLPLPSDCRTRAKPNADAAKNGLLQMAAPSPNSPAVPAH